MRLNYESKKLSQQPIEKYQKYVNDIGKFRRILKPANVLTISLTFFHLANLISVEAGFIPLTVIEITNVCIGFASLCALCSYKAAPEIRNNFFKEVANKSLTISSAAFAATGSVCVLTNVKEKWLPPVLFSSALSIFVGFSFYQYSKTKKHDKNKGAHIDNLEQKQFIQDGELTRHEETLLKWDSLSTALGISIALVDVFFVLFLPNFNLYKISDKVEKCVHLVAGSATGITACANTVFLAYSLRGEKQDLTSFQSQPEGAPPTNS